MVNAEETTNALKSSSFLLQLYLRVSQTTYAVVAFPIGTVLSIGPLCLFLEKGMSIQAIGGWMAGGELVGILAMTLSEKTEGGFVFKRPYDLYFINVALAACLVMIPVWKPELVILSCIFMLCVQAFNSSSKPVVGESIHRLAVLTDNEPHVIFAQANTLRRIGNATIGAITPLIFSVARNASFYAVGGVMMAFLVLVVAVDMQIKTVFEETVEESNHPEGNPATPSDENEGEGGKRAIMSKQYSTISRLKSYRRRTTMDVKKIDPIKSAISEDGFGGSMNASMGSIGEESSDSDDDVVPELNGGLKDYIQKRKSLEGSISEEFNCLEVGDEDEAEEDDAEAEGDEESTPVDESPKKGVSFAPEPETTGEKDLESMDDTEAKGDEESTPVDESPRKGVSFAPEPETTGEKHLESMDDAEAEGDEEPTPVKEFPRKGVSFATEEPETKREKDLESMNDDLLDESEQKKPRGLALKGGNETETVSSEKKFGFGYFLIVLAFPFWDAVISRLPFAFLTISLVDGYDQETQVAEINATIQKTAGVLFGYQIGRAASQWIQVWKATSVVNYLLNSVAFIAYIVMMVYVFQVPEGNMWFIPLMLTGFAETLPIQQHYMIGLFPDAEDDDVDLRNAVKKSHTATGIGSMAAFLFASQTYHYASIKGIAVLGFGFMICKIGTNIVIDYIHYQNELEYKKKNRRCMQHYGRQSMMMVN